MVTIRCEHGVHLRVAARVVGEMRDRQARVTIRCQGCRDADACSILDLLEMGAACGVAVEIVAEGTDADAAMQAVADILAHGGEP